MLFGLCSGGNRAHRACRGLTGLSPEPRRILAFTPAREFPNHLDPHSQSERPSCVCHLSETDARERELERTQVAQSLACRSSLGAEQRGEKDTIHQLRDQISAELKQAGSGAISLKSSLPHHKFGEPLSRYWKAASDCSGPPLPLARAPPTSICGGFRLAYLGPRSYRGKKVLWRKSTASRKARPLGL